MLSECLWVYDTAFRGDNVGKDMEFKGLFGLLDNCKWAAGAGYSAERSSLD